MGFLKDKFQKFEVLSLGIIGLRDSGSRLQHVRLRSKFRIQSLRLRSAELRLGKLGCKVESLKFRV